MAPALWRDRVIFTSGDTVVRAFEDDTGEIIWERHFQFPVSSSPTVAGDRVYFGVRGDESEGASGSSPRLVCLSAKDGRILWDMDTEGAVLSAPVISGKRMIFGTEHNRFYVLEELF
jgi:outer membrane protein assembly factor BamB